ncbi:MAG: addiction module protein [Gemmataceae bacterium]|nr:addiction module protein [Gemmataceae bacterium]
MGDSLRTVLAGALALSESDRGEVAARLLASLDSPSKMDESDESDVEQSWADEIQKRLADVRSGAVTSVPWDAARRQILEDGDDGAR